jgi:hypothetical protein
MKFSTLLFLLIISFTQLLFGQLNESFPSNSVYLEIGGIGGFGSVNYERKILEKQSYRLNTRAGISTYHLKDFSGKFNPDLIIPLGVNAVFGEKHGLELGLNQIIASVILTNLDNFMPYRSTTLNASAAIGYRYQKSETGILIRVLYSPIYERYSYFNHWAGISLGYGF